MGMLVSSEDILCQFPDQFIRSGGKKVRLEPYTAHITTYSFRKCTSLSFRAKVLLHFPASYLLTYLPNQNNLINVKTKLIVYFKLSGSYDNMICNTVYVMYPLNMNDDVLYCTVS